MTAQTREALQYLDRIIPRQLRNPVIGIICGSGLSALAATVTNEPKLEINYSDIPYFPRSTGT